MTISKMRPRISQSISWLEVFAVVAFAAIAVFLRYYQIGQVPPGLNSDEAVGAVGALETLRHGPQLYYSGQGGGGSLGFYIAAIGFALFGPSVATIRGTAAFAGVIGVVATYFATREMFRFSDGDDVKSPGLNSARMLALLAMLGMAISLWHTRSSRVAFAAVGVPFLQVPGNYFLWRGLNTGRRIHFVVSGVLLASLMYIYLSGSFAPFVYLVFFLLEWLVVIVHSRLQAAKRVPSANPESRVAAQLDNRKPPLLKQHFINLVVCASVAFLLFLPLLYFYLTAPDLATERAQQALFTNPLINQGDLWGTLWRSIWGNLAAFGLSTNWLTGGPPANLILPVPLSLLFLLGFAISLWRIRQPPYLFALVYWAIMLVPSILSPDAIPHTLRAVGAAPAAYTLIAVGVVGILDFAGRLVNWVATKRGASYVVEHASNPQAGLSGGLATVVLAALGLAVVGPVYQGFHYYMVEWPKTNDAQAAFHVYAVELAKEMSKETNPQAVFLLPRDTAAGDVNPNYTVMFLYNGQADYAWVVDDENRLEATLNSAVQGHDVVHVVRWKTSKHTGADPKEIIRYYLEKNGNLVDKQSFEYYDIETYQLDQLGPDLTDAALTPTEVDFAGQISLIGYAYGDASGAEKLDAPSVPAGNLLWVHLRFRMVGVSQEDLKASVLVTDAAGHVVGQIDKLLLNNILHQGASHWEPGSQVDAYYLVPIAPATAPGDYRLGVTVYGADSLARLPAGTDDATQVVKLGALAIRPDLSPPAVEALNLNMVLNQPVTEELTLVGFSTSVSERVRPGEQAALALVWRADQTPSSDYRVSLQAVRGEQAWPLTDSVPLAGLDYPSSRWKAGEVVWGWLDARVPRDSETGDYELKVVVVDPAGNGVADFPLGTLHVESWPRQFDAPPMQTGVGANFGNQIELLGYDLSAGDGESGMLHVVLYWRAMSEMEVGYTTFVHVLDAGGQLVSQVDHAPGGGAFPTTGWLADEVIADEFSVPIPQDRSLATQLEVGIYDSITGKRLPVLGEAHEKIDTRVLLRLSNDSQSQ
jgi:hypothetical protein